MLCQTVLLSLLAATVSAVASPEVTSPPSIKDRDFADDLHSIISDASSFIGGAASDVGSFATCVDRLLGIVDTNVPTPTGDLESAIESAFITAGASDLCLGTAVPNSLTSSFSQYESSLVTWFSSASKAIQSAADACPSLDASQLETVSKLLPCSTALDAAGVTAVAFTGNSTTTSSNDKGAAPRLTGVVAGAAAIAIGAAAALL